MSTSTKPLKQQNLSQEEFRKILNRKVKEVNIYDPVPGTEQILIFIADNLKIIKTPQYAKLLSTIGKKLIEFGKEKNWGHEKSKYYWGLIFDDDYPITSSPKSSSPKSPPKSSPKSPPKSSPKSPPKSSPKSPPKSPPKSSPTKFDLNKVEYKNGKFYYENKKFPKGTRIGSGATAEVKRFTLPNVGSFVVKIFKRKEALVYEIALLEYMKKFNCNIIESRVIKGDDYIFLLFENMTGDLEELKGKLTSDKIIEIIKDIVEQIKCLSKINLYYTDIKLSNILFTFNNGESKILLGDLGSLAVGSETSKEIKKTMKSLDISEEDIDSSFTSIATYPPPESCESGRFEGHIANCGPEAGSDQVACIAAILWGLGVLALSLMFSVGAVDTRRGGKNLHGYHFIIFVIIKKLKLIRKFQI